MAAPKHRADATGRIDAHFAALPDWSRKICENLRKLVLQSDPRLIEDWKWSPNYYLDGMVCGIISSKKYVSLVFFRGTQLKDRKKILQGNPENLNIRSMRFTDVKEINDEILLEYVFEAIDNNRKGIQPKKSSDKTVVIPPDIKKAFKKARVFDYFQHSPYSRRKEYVAYITHAKKPETRLRRTEKIINALGSKHTSNVIRKK